MVYEQLVAAAGVQVAHDVVPSLTVEVVAHADQLSAAAVVFLDPSSHVPQAVLVVFLSLPSSAAHVLHDGSAALLVVQLDQVAGSFGLVVVDQLDHVSGSFGLVVVVDHVPQSSRL